MGFGVLGWSCDLRIWQVSLRQLATRKSDVLQLWAEECGDQGHWHKGLEMKHLVAIYLKRQ